MIPKHNAKKTIATACALALAVLTFAASAFSVTAIASSSAQNENASAGSEFTAAESKPDSHLSKNGLFHVLAAHEVTLDNNGEVKKLLVSEGKVSDILKSENIEIGDNCVVIPGEKTEINSDVKIVVREGKFVSVTADGKTEKKLLPLGNVAAALNMAGVNVSKNDLLSVSRDSKVEDISEVTVKRVTFKDEVTTEEIEFESVTEDSDDLELGEKEVKTKGENGKMEITTRTTFVDGKKTDSEVVDKKVVKEPVSEVTLVGTKGAGSSGGAGTFTDSNGNTVAYKYVVNGSGTAYTAPAGAHMSTGAAVYEGAVAVNPNVIPYGSKVYVEASDGSMTYGYATAADTGGALMDGSAVVDCFYFSYDRCVNWGKRDVNVYVL